ncbi:CSC1-like protein At4g02900 [Hondaea fermentalgiana]|uniref:CSC1-like protein At4g02900 n=1 Tax=Hondaea fermentalgiana TaxID=2315210 RepID=A0A2R5GFI4_9STRA|nr:CSC1-like protein At4g02900 [Hondaea fermentalgiana]|eukprot:GBG29680.1 CSC1-like protein At4g02900 [Hondaea fermentalgiana]
MVDLAAAAEAAANTGTPPPTMTPPDKSQVEESLLLYGGLVALSLALYSVLRKRCSRVMIPAAKHGDVPASRELDAYLLADGANGEKPRNNGGEVSTPPLRPSEARGHGRGRGRNRDRHDPRDENTCGCWSWFTRCKACGCSGSLASLDMSWSWKALALRERDLVRIAGLDAYIFLRVVRFCWAVMTGYAVVALVFLIPVYLGQPMPARCKSVCESQASAHHSVTADPDDPWDAASCICSDIDRASMANIAAGSSALWTPVLVMYIFTMSTLWATSVEYRAMVRIKRRYWSSAPPEAYSVLVEHLPPRLCDRSGRLLYEYFDRVFPDRVFAVSMVDTGTDLSRRLRGIGVQRNKALWKLEHATVDYYRAQEHVLAPQQGCCGGSCCTNRSSSNGSATSKALKCWHCLMYCVTCGKLPYPDASQVRQMRSHVENLEESLEDLNAEFAIARNEYHQLCNTVGKFSATNGARRMDSFKSFGSLTDSLDESFSVLERGQTGGASVAEPPPSPSRPDKSKFSPSGAAVDEQSNGGDDGTATRLLPRDEDAFFSSAFVTFRTLKASTVASQTQIDDKSDMRVVPAPEPLDVAWDNLGMTTHERVVRRAVTKTVFYLLVVFWGVLTSVVGASTSTPALARQIPAIKSLLEKYPHLAGYMDMLAPLVLVSLVGVVNPLMSLLARFEGRISESAADKRAMERYFIFLVVQVFLFYSIAGTVFKTLVEILQQPSRIVSTLGSSLPRNAAFYLQFVVVKLFWMLCFELLRVADVILALLRRLVAGLPRTERERISLFCGCFELTYPGPISIPSTLSQVLLVYFISIVYAVIQPLIVLVAFCFFALANVCYSTILTSATKQMYDSGGRFWWNSAYRCIVGGLVTAQLTLMGVMVIKGSIGMAIPLWFLVFGTIFVAYKLEARYATLVSTLPMHLAAELDEIASENTVEVRPALWQYGSKTFPGTEGPEAFYNILRPSSARSQAASAPAQHVYCFDHPVLQEQTRVKPFELRRAPSSRYGTLTP